MKQLSSIFFLLVLSLWAADFWQAKPYTEWNDKETQRLLDSSPWARQVEIARMGGGGLDTPSGAGGPGGGRGRGGPAGYMDVNQVVEAAEGLISISPAAFGRRQQPPL